MLIVTKAIVNYIEQFTFMNLELVLAAIYITLMVVCWLAFAAFDAWLVRLGEKIGRKLGEAHKKKYLQQQAKKQDREI